MEPMFPVEHGHQPPVVPPAPHHGPGKKIDGQIQGWRVGGGDGGGRARPVVTLLLFLGVTVGFAFGVYHARHSRRDLVFAIVTCYLFVVLACCVAMLRQLRRDPAATAVERGRVRIGAWCVTVALGTTVTSRVADAMPGLALKLVVWGVSVVLHGLALYFLFFREGADAEELGCGKADAGRGGLSPEEKV